MAKTSEDGVHVRREWAVLWRDESKEAAVRPGRFVRPMPSKSESAEITLHEGDLPSGLALGDVVAVDCETMGLNPVRDRLCLVQLSSGDGRAHLVRLDGEDWSAPNLCRLLEDPAIVKLFHFARFDLAMLRHWLGVSCRPVWCTKIASKLVRTYTDRHGLKDLCADLLGENLNKQQQTSDWGAAELSRAQQSYAAGDVLYLHALKEKLGALLEREGRSQIAHACFDFLPYRAQLDTLGWDGVNDIFNH